MPRRGLPSASRRRCGARAGRRRRTPTACRVRFSIVSSSVSPGWAVSRSSSSTMPLCSRAGDSVWGVVGVVDGGSPPLAAAVVIAGRRDDRQPCEKQGQGGASYARGSTSQWAPVFHQRFVDRHERFGLRADRQVECARLLHP